MSEDDEALLCRVACYYHHDGLTQHEVGRRLGLSHIEVSRLLEKGKHSAIIGITVHSEHRGCLELETRLRERHDLAEAFVAPVPDPPNDAIAWDRAMDEHASFDEGGYVDSAEIVGIDLASLRRVRRVIGGITTRWSRAVVSRTSVRRASSRTRISGWRSVAPSSPTSRPFWSA